MACPIQGGSYTGHLQRSCDAKINWRITRRRNIATRCDLGFDIRFEPSSSASATFDHHHSRFSIPGTIDHRASHRLGFDSEKNRKQRTLLRGFLNLPPLLQSGYMESLVVCGREVLRLGRGGSLLHKVLGPATRLERDRKETDR